MDRFEGGTRINYRITENKTQHTENGKSVSRRKMGETLVKFKIYGSDGRFVELEATVDTGATFTKIPESVASELELQAKYETEEELGDKRMVGRLKS